MAPSWTLIVLFRIEDGICSCMASTLDLSLTPPIRSKSAPLLGKHGFPDCVRSSIWTFGYPSPVACKEADREEREGERERFLEGGNWTQQQSCSLNEISQLHESFARLT